MDSISQFTVALAKNGKVFSWGVNSCGQLGHAHGGYFDSRRVPTKVESLDGLDIVKISCGGEHTA